jgi:hypothetical protein
MGGSSRCGGRKKASFLLRPSRISLPPVVGEFDGNRGEFYDQEQYKGRAILMRYVWLNISPKSARME